MNRRLCRMAMRHTRLDTTLENYVKDIPASVYLVADAMYERIVGPVGSVQ